MFKSKGFTIGFIILCALNLFLIFGLIYVSSGRADSNMNKIVQTTEAGETQSSPTGVIPDEPTTPEPATEAPVVVRALTTEDPHTMPVVGELIPEQGTLSINESAAVGVVFHKLPAFDSAETEGNLVNYRGSFQVDGKIYVTDTDGKPYLMYHTAEDYYVTSNTTYVNYTPSLRMVAENSEKVTSFASPDGKSELAILQEDGNHLIFSLKRNGQTILDNVVAVYDAYGTARFEYLSAQGAATGDLSFSYEEGRLSLVTAVFSKEISLNGDRFNTLSLAVKN